MKYTLQQYWYSLTHWFYYWNKFLVNKTKGGFFARGAMLTLTLSTRCNLNCKYCPLMFGKTKRPIYDEYGIGEWMKFIKNYGEWISYVIVSGGEPSMIHWMPEFVNWLISTRRKVVVVTNLFSPDLLSCMKVSKQLQIFATYHHGDNPNHFDSAYKYLKAKGYNITANELDNERKVLSYSHSKQFITPEIAKEQRYFHCRPDAPKTRTIYCGSEWLY